MVKAKSILSSFNLTESNKSVVIDKVTERRNKLLKSLNEQRLSATAAIDGKEYFGEKQVLQTNDDGEKVKATVQKRVKQWFYTNDKNEWLLEVRYGNKPLQLAEGKTAIVVGTKEKLIEVIDTVIEAVKAKELDDIITKAVTDRTAKRKQQKVA